MVCESVERESMVCERGVAEPRGDSERRQSVMPAPDRVLAVRPLPTAPTPVIGVLDSGLAGGRYNQDGMRPDLLGLDQLSLEQIRGQLDVPSLPIGPYPADNYLDPVAGHGTFIAGIIEQLTPGCTMRVRRVFEPQGDVTVSTLAHHLWVLMESPDRPTIVNLSFGGTGHGRAREPHRRLLRTAWRRVRRGGRQRGVVRRAVPGGAAVGDRDGSRARRARLRGPTTASGSTRAPPAPTS